MSQTIVAVEEMELTLARKSWTAYVGIVLLGVFLLLIVARPIWGVSKLAGLISFVIFSAFVVYRFLSIKSVRLYSDEHGIWVYSGVLPWEKGVHGVKWRDLDDAVYFKSMFSWLFKSYTMRLGHRFTKSSEIILTHIERGDQVVTEINSRHERLVRSESLA